MKQIELFSSKIQFSAFIGIILMILAANLTYHYYDFKNFKAEPTRILNAKILQAYEKINKKGKIYKVIKLKTNDFEFYTTSRKDANLSVNQNVEIGVFTKNVKFKDYLGKRFYMPNFKILPSFDASKKAGIFTNFKEKMINFIVSQHENEKMREFYSTLYFATDMSKELRANVTNWGIAHIVSISGFHIGIIFSFIFITLLPIYRFFQNRYFPYRSAKIDITNMIMIFLLIYLFVLDFTPSFLRSLAMCAVGYFFVLRNLKIINFMTLFLAIFLLVAVFPSLAFSLGFYFSSLGVLFIFIFLHHFWKNFGVITATVLLNIYVFLCMNVPVYYFFPIITVQQISVIPLGYVFIIFYPLSVILHLLGFGEILDEAMLNFLNFALPNYQTDIPFLIFLTTNICAILGIHYRFFAVLCAIFGILPIFFI